METKSKFFLCSLTFWGVALTALGSFIHSYTGVKIDDQVAPLQAALANLIAALQLPAFTGPLAQICGISATLIGRFRAAGPLHFIAPTAPPLGTAAATSAATSPTRNIVSILIAFAIASAAVLGLSGCGGGSSEGSSPASPTAAGVPLTGNQKLQSGLQTAGVIGNDLLTDLLQGAITYADAQTALGAAQQSMGGHGVSVSNIGTYAQAEASAANTSGLSTAAQQLQTDISSQLAQGLTPAQISNQLTAAQTQLPVPAPPNPSQGSAPATTNAAPVSF